MNITVKVDEVSLSTAVATVLGRDEETGEPYSMGEDTIGELVARQIVCELQRHTESWGRAADRYCQVRDELIREQVTPLIEEAIRRPITRTNLYGEVVGSGPTTLAELITAEAQKALTRPVGDSYSRSGQQTLVQKIVAEQIQAALTTEIADAVRQARAAVRDEIGTAVAAAVTKSIR